ncbi:MAG: glycosyltransferase family 4 protein [Anaerolineae bacterium]|nr:glycosyltransferase family 4 protein [Anaerolineae bacterium]
MHIGLVTGEFPPMQGGIGAYSRILAEHLADLGHNVSILTGERARYESNRIHLANVIHHWDARAWMQARAWVRDQQLDLACIQYQTAAYAMSPWIHFLPDILRPLPVVTTFHDLRVPYLFPKAGPLRTWIVRRLARFSAGVIATNHEDMNALAFHDCRKLIPIGSNITTALPESFDAGEWRARARAAQGDFLIAHFGLINRSKGLDVLLRALATLRGDGVPARLLIVGGTSGDNDPTNLDYAKEIEALIESLELRPYIHQTGYLDERDVGAYLRAADAVALPFHDGASYRRGSLMAALRYACPIVTTTPAVAIPAFVDGDNLLCVAPEDASALAAALRRLHDDPELRHKLSQGAAALAPTFDWAQIAREHVDFFGHVLETCA